MKKLFLITACCALLLKGVEAQIVTNGFFGSSHQIDSNNPYFTFAYSTATGQLDGSNNTIQPAGFAIDQEQFFDASEFYVRGYGNSTNSLTSSISNLYDIFSYSSTNYQVLVNEPISVLPYFNIPHPTIFQISPGQLIDANITNNGKSSWYSEGALEPLTTNKSYYAAIRWGDGAGNYNYGYAKLSTGQNITGTTNVSSISLEQIVAQTATNVGLSIPTNAPLISYDWTFNKNAAPGDLLVSPYPNGYSSSFGYFDYYIFNIDNLGNLYWSRNSTSVRGFVFGVTGSATFGEIIPSGDVSHASEWSWTSQYLSPLTNVDSNNIWITRTWSPSGSYLNPYGLPLSPTNTTYFLGIRKTESTGNYRYGFIQFSKGSKNSYGNPSLYINRIAFSPNLNQAITVPLLTPTLGSFTIPAKTYGATNFALTAPISTSIGAWSYSSGNTNVATVSSNIVTIRGVGTAVIRATQASSGNYLGASTIGNFVVNFAAPTLGSFTVPAKTYGAATFALTDPTSTSSGAWNYSSGNTNVATVSRNIVTIRGVGTAVITATQAASGNYLGASTTGNLVVNFATPALGSFTVPAKTYGAATFALTAPTSTSSGAWSYSSGNTNVATVSSNIVTIRGVGTAVITATQAANGNYTGGVATGSLIVYKGSQMITFTLPSTKSFTTNGLIPLSGFDSANLPITYTSGNNSILTISGTNAVMKSKGTTTVTASQPGNSNYNAATNVVRRITVQ